MSETKATILVIDRKASLVMELRDDLKTTHRKCERLKVNWWISELDSLGMKKSKQEESNKGQVLENLTDDIKQKFIYDYKACYSE
jgi:1,2-phenylacetyl-CoA epoxidase catalytic subunit